MKQPPVNTLKIAFAVAISLCIAACGEQKVRNTDEGQGDRIDSMRTDIVNVSGILFSIPSPVQTTLLVKKSGATYDRRQLNDPEFTSRYITNHQRALNAGVYGTDMAYASVFEDGQTALKAYKALDELADVLGISSAVDQSLIRRIAGNVGNTDSLLILSGRFYSAADGYLKENHRYDIAALVLTGGWIESLHLTAQEAVSGNEAAAARVAEQKTTASTVVKALSKTCDAEFLKGELYKQLRELESLYSAVSSTYTYQEPVTIPDQRTTYLKSSTNYEISNETLGNIAEKIKTIRNLTIQPS